MIAILGAGSWGTALAIHLASKRQPVHLWGHQAAHMETLRTTRFNPDYLPNFRLPDSISCFSCLPEAVQQAQTILIALPSAAFEQILQALKPWLLGNKHLLWATKGLCNGRWLHEVMQTILGNYPAAVLSGPTFAAEIAQGLPSLATIASTTPNLAQQLCLSLQSHHFRITPSFDVIGVELAGAMKNVVAIAVGISAGLGMAVNTQSALITNGLGEMLKLGLALGGHAETFLGAAGVGDLILTCTSNQSRNWRLGFAIGRGQSIQIAQQTLGQVAEGIETSGALVQKAQKNNITLPLCSCVYQVLYEQRSPSTIVDTLFQMTASEQRREK